MITSAAPSLGTTNENTAIDVALSAFINDGEGTTTITDADSGAVVGGDRHPPAFGNGTWAYSLDGTTFQAMGAVGPAAARLLPRPPRSATRRTRRMAKPLRSSSAAWDTTTGTAGGTADLSQSAAVGGSTALSSASDTASLTVTSVNDAPRAHAAGHASGRRPYNEQPVDFLPPRRDLYNNSSIVTTITDADTAAVLGGIAITYTTGNGAWEYTLDGTTYKPLSNVADATALLLPNYAALRDRPSATNLASESPSLIYCAWDMTTGASGGPRRPVQSTDGRRRRHRVQQRHRHALCDCQLRAGLDAGGEQSRGRHDQRRRRADVHFEELH